MHISCGYISYTIYTFRTCISHVMHTLRTKASDGKTCIVSGDVHIHFVHARNLLPAKCRPSSTIAQIMQLSGNVGVRNRQRNQSSSYHK